MTLEADWDRCGPWISAALRYTGEPPTHTLDDVLQAVRKGQMQFWPAERSAAVTEIAVYPRVVAVRIFLAGGDLEDLRGVEARIADWAKTIIRAQRIEICGRAGWQRALTGYRAASTWLCKEIEDV